MRVIFVHYVAVDYGWCALKKDAFKENGEVRICPRSECPDGYVCKHLAFFGVCCPKDSEGIETNLCTNLETYFTNL